MTVFDAMGIYLYVCHNPGDKKTELGETEVQ